MDTGWLQTDRPSHLWKPLHLCIVQWCRLCMQVYARTAHAQVQGQCSGKLVSKPLGFQLAHATHTAVSSDTRHLGCCNLECPQSLQLVTLLVLLFRGTLWPCHPDTCLHPISAQDVPRYLPVNTPTFLDDSTVCGFFYPWRKYCSRLLWCPPHFKMHKATCIWSCCKSMKVCQPCAADDLLHNFSACTRWRDIVLSCRVARGGIEQGICIAR